MSTPEQQQEAAAGPQQEQLWEYFVVVGLPKAGLQTVNGDAGFLGTDQKYKAAFVDSLPHSHFDEASRLPPQLPTCCLPAGIDIVLYQDLEKAVLTPHTFACVLTGGDGAQLYVSCLTFYDRVPSELCAKHEDLLGAVALKAMCLLSKRPYLDTSQQVLRELYRCTFQTGSSIPVPDLIKSLLAVPCPQQGSPKLCLRLSGSRHVLCPPLPLGPPPGEVSLQPLLEVMQPDSLVGLFAAVLLEQRVLLRSRHHWLLTVAAESVVRLLYPLKYQHVYIPVMPSSLADYLEAPTPFLMGLQSGEPVDQRTLDMLVVADLDRGSLHLGKDDSLMKRCLSHPYLRRLERRIRMLMQPSVTEADVVPLANSGPEDPWVLAAKALGPHEPWNPRKQALLLRTFMEFFHEVLRDYQLFLCASSQEASERASLARSSSRFASGGGSSISSNSSNGGALPAGWSSRTALSLGGAGAGAGLVPARANSLAANAVLQVQGIVGMQALLDHHRSICRHKDPALLQQVMQGLPFLSFVGEHSSVQQEPMAWLKAGELTLSAWRAAEEDLQAMSNKTPAAAAVGSSAAGQATRSEAAAAVAVHSAGARSVSRARQHLCLADKHEDGFAGTILCIPDQPPSGLMPAKGLLHQSFPALVLSEYSERALGGKRRKTAVSRQKRPSAGRRRAISELMGSPLDLRRKTPLQGGTNTDTSPRLLRGNPLDTSGAASQLQTPLAPGLQLPSLSKISNVSTASTSASLSEEYSTEAELIGRQIGMLVHLMQVASAAAAKGSSDAAAAAADAAACHAAAGDTSTAGANEPDISKGQATREVTRKGSLGGVNAAAVLRRYSSNGARSSNHLAADVLEAACQLLCIQTGGNGWFIVSRLKELVANPPAPCSAADSSSAAAAASAHSPTGASARGSPAAAANSKKGAAASPGSKGSSPQGKTMLAKSGKLLGVNLSGSSSSKSSGLAALTLSHGVESFASAASAMALAIGRNGSSSKQKYNSSSGASNTSSPTNTGDSSKIISSAPTSMCGSGAQTVASVLASAPAFNHSVSCRADEREHNKVATNSEGGAVPAALCSSSSTSSSSSSTGPASGDTPVSTGTSTGPTGAGLQASATPAEDTPSSSATSSSSSTPSKPPAQAEATAAAEKQATGDAMRPAECPVPPEVFDVLSAMLRSIIEVAASQDDSRVVLTVLELASVISCTTGGTKRYLLSTLAGSASLHTEVFWAFTFAFAVSSSYLTADNFTGVKEVVTKCLHQFAGYLAGVGIPGAAAWVLLMQLATEHLQMAHAGQLGPSTLLDIRRHFEQARQHYGMDCPAPAAGAAGTESAAAAAAAVSAMATQSPGQCGSAGQQGPPSDKLKGTQQQESQRARPKGASLQQVADALQACGITLPNLQDRTCAAAAGTSSSVWHTAAAPGLPVTSVAAVTIATPGAAADGTKAAVTIPAPGAAADAAVDQAQATNGSGAASSRVSVSSGTLGSAASDTEAPVAGHRPLSPLNPAAAAAPNSPRSPASVSSSPQTPLTTPFSNSTRAVGSLASPRSPVGTALRVKEGYGSYAKMLNRQATGSIGNNTAAAAALAAAGGEGAAGAAGANGDDAEAGAQVKLYVQGDSLVDQGGLQWAAVHSKAVVAMAAQSHTAVSAGLDGYLKVLDLSGGTMRLAASMAIPALQDTASNAALTALPVLQLWYDGQRAAVGNSRHQSVWIVDLKGMQPSVELTGLGSAVSCMSPLYRNKQALLSGLAYGSKVLGLSSKSSSNHLAAAYLWDLRKPRRPATSLNFAPVQPAVGAQASSGGVLPAAGGSSCTGFAGSSSSSGSSTALSGIASGVPGLMCLCVHEDGASAAGGCRDGRVLIWDMRKCGAPVSECTGHTGPVTQINFLPRSASAAAGLGRTPLLLTGSEDWTARVWDADTGACRGACIGHGGAVTAMQTVHSNAATRFVTGAADGSIGLWGLDGHMVSLVQQHEQPVLLLKQGVDTLVSGAADKSCHVWGLQGLLPSSNGSSSSNGASPTGQLSRLLASHDTPAAVGAMAFDPMAELLCSGHKDGTVSVWNCSHSMQCSTIFE